MRIIELIDAYNYRHPGEFQAAINRQEAMRGALQTWWVTKEGVKLKPFQMTDRHLLSIIKMMEDQAEKRAVLHSAKRILKSHATYKAAKREAIKRGLIQE
ncbi:hypothetical protein SAMN02799624_05279 [Paenibacillus sp. UNC496MF]|uniref:hypothetical protein n=1 Tax=Paenibacillus sp. UNC496MF TaxID=1502753 RepID=UPI0008F0F151|nr:hypothetical protein [Paenibacillus sp. UNC496MF]SFJ63411.1 hypothetical protein SAMN02799624_05279 [Paenibacillus sp. UNC496MF]